MNDNPDGTLGGAEKHRQGALSIFKTDELYLFGEPVELSTKVEMVTQTCVPCPSSRCISW